MRGVFMPVSALTGSRLRERRGALGLRQADLAATAGISASYLNLIEHNRRRISENLLEQLAQALGQPVAMFQEGVGGAVLEGLRAAAAEVPGAEVDRIEDFAGRYPGWAGGVTSLQQRAAGGQADEQGIASPQEEVEAWLAAADWRVLDDGAGLASGAARAMARDLAAVMRADAAALPDQAFAQALDEIGPDPARLAARFGVDELAAFRRIALRPQAEVGLGVCDASGTLTFRKPVAGFALPRFGAACPLWPFFAALGQPMRPIETVIETAGPQGRRFLVRAFCRLRFPGGFRGPELREAAMLILPDHARTGEALAVGSTCRVCQRLQCPARREPSILTA